MTNWHRLFGIMLSDVFTGTPYDVELEKDLSVQQQFLDVVVIRKRPGEHTERLPDGLDNLADHNLVSFKSHRDVFGVWAVCELVGHYVSYRKQITPSNVPMLPEGDFRLYGVCARFPTQLAAPRVTLNELQPGVFECNVGMTVRLIVARDLPNEEHNAPLHLFSADRNKLKYGQDHFQQRSPKTSTLIQDLFGNYQQEGVTMAYTLDDYQRESWERALREMPIDKVLKTVSVEKLLENISTEQLLSRLSAAEIEAYLKKLKGESLTKEEST